MEITAFVMLTWIEQHHLDELGHANYNELKKIFERVRHQLCKFLGFGRKKLRTRLGIGLVMTSDTYKYHRSLKQTDMLLFRADIQVTGSASIKIRLRFMSHGRGRKAYELDPTNEVIYEMVMINLATEKPIRLPKPIRRVIETFDPDEFIVWYAKNRPTTRL